MHTALTVHTAHTVHTVHAVRTFRAWSELRRSAYFRAFCSAREMEENKRIPLMRGCDRKEPFARIVVRGSIRFAFA